MNGEYHQLKGSWTEGVLFGLAALELYVHTQASNLGVLFDHDLKLNEQYNPSLKGCFK